MKYRFDYPAVFKTLPEYTAHSGQLVDIVRELSSTENENESRMFEIRAADGWIGHAFEDELIEAC